MKQRGGSGNSWELANPAYYEKLRAMTPEQQAIFLEQERIQAAAESVRQQRRENSPLYKLYFLIRNENIDINFNEPFRNAKQELVRHYYFDIIVPQMTHIRTANYPSSEEETNSFKHIVKQFIDDGVTAFKPWITSYFKSSDSNYHIFQRMLRGYTILFPEGGGYRKQPTRRGKHKSSRTRRRRR